MSEPTDPPPPRKPTDPPADPPAVETRAPTDPPRAKTDPPRAKTDPPRAASQPPVDQVPKPPTLPAVDPDAPADGIPQLPHQPSPESAAMEAARLVSEVVDIDTPTGAVVAAHAAATAAVAAASSTSMAAHRDDEPEFDPVAIAAAAINRLRRRAQTDLAELRGQYHRHDLLVIVLALVMIVAGGRIYKRLVTPTTVTFAVRGLTFERSTAWLPAEPVAPSPPRILRDVNPMPPQAPDASENPNAFYNVELTSSIDPAARIEVMIDKLPAWSNGVTLLDLERRSRWGEMYAMDKSSVASIEGHDWLRTEYRFAHAAQKGDVPRIERAIEYATKGKELYVVTLFGTPAELERMEEVVAPTLRVSANVGMQIASQSNPLAHATYPTLVERAFESTVMVVVADLVDGRLVPKGGGSGVIVGGDGSVLTNYHVIHDHDGRLHDVFVIGRFAQRDHAPQLVCAGKPGRGKVQRDIDLALVKCDMDLDGRSWTPQGGPGVWATLPERRTTEIKIGQHVWVLGYPDVGGGGLTLQAGNVIGWTGVDGTTGRDYIKTDASVTNGNSGGPVVDDEGHLVGIASAYRTKIDASGKAIEITTIGLVRPLSTASDLLAIAAAGWVPRDGHTEVELTPSAIDAPAEGGVRLSTRVLDAATLKPIPEALVEVLKPGVDYDVNRRDDMVLAWGKSNSVGEVMLKQPVPIPGTYTVIVTANGYEPLIGRDALHLEANTPAGYDPWGQIWLRAR